MTSLLLSSCVQCVERCTSGSCIPVAKASENLLLNRLPSRPRNRFRTKPFGHCSLSARRCPRIRAQASDEWGSWRQMEFGKAGATREVWEKFAQRGRDAFLAEWAKGPEMDLVLAHLQLSAEDDAWFSHSVVELPVATYVARVDKMVDDMCVAYLDELVEPLAHPQQVLDKVEEYLFGWCRFCIADAGELASPYRMYAHHVIAQNCGTPSAVAIMLTGVVQRLVKRGLLPPSVEVYLSGPSSLPHVRLRGSSTQGVAVSSQGLIIDILKGLKRAFWPWEWDPRAPSGFLPAAEAVLQVSGRVGTANRTTGVIQGMGRPYGDLTRARLATERLAITVGGIHVRDLALLNYHLGDTQKSYSLLLQYCKGAAAEAAQRPPLVLGALLEDLSDPSDAALCQALLDKMERVLLEKSWKASPSEPQK